MDFQTLPAIPSLSKLYRGQVAGLIRPGGKPPVSSAPATGYQVEDVCFDAESVARYCHLIGFRLRDAVPATYPYLLSFPLVMQVMSAKDFPFRAVGTVHISNLIEQHRALRIGDNLDIRVHADNLRPHRKGLAIDMVTSIDVAGSEAWRQTSTFLGVGASFADSAPAELRDRPQAQRLLPKAREEALMESPVALLRWSFEQVREYAQVSGDKNPIHVSRAGAKAFGFPRPIAHGMYSHARMLASLEGRIPQEIRVLADFYAPLTVPATTALLSRDDGAGAWDLWLRPASDPKKLHVAARVEPMDLLGQGR
ncbi:MaoC family dehydratase [Corynebacterium flavescens]|uniref:MaoC family dehydratase n=1 Tax=Corynebacterium flavescens TaxID=28028 RepID=UPI003FCF299E